MKIFTKKFWWDLDVKINKEIFNGTHETMSDRMGEKLLEGRAGCCNWRYHLCKFLSWIEKVFTGRKDKVRHCIESVKTTSDD